MSDLFNVDMPETEASEKWIPPRHGTLTQPSGEGACPCFSTGKGARNMAGPFAQGCSLPAMPV